ncbi:MAG: S9 family peptidase [Candidatus Obscuribacter sp.]|nr:S9 family peptidase [Candidatus Obscuribacter sp.]
MYPVKLSFSQMHRHAQRWSVSGFCLLLIGAVNLGYPACPLNPVFGATTLSDADSYLWLEDIDSKKSLTWVRAQNKPSQKSIESLPGFEPLRERILKILDSPAKIPYVTKYGEYYYNYWTDAKNVRGLWRRTTLSEYQKAEPKWEVVLDLDKLAASEKENWVWHGADVLEPSYDRCLISLSRGGGDKEVVREFDLNTRAFIKDGFCLPEAKSVASWIDRDNIYVGTDFGPGSLTDSGYARLVKKWQRGTPLSEAKQVFAGQKTDVSVIAYAFLDHGKHYEVIHRGVSFYKNMAYLKRGDDWVLIDKPEDADVSLSFDMLFLRLRSDWTVGGKTYGAGSLIAADVDAYMAGKRAFTVFYQPGPRKSYSGRGITKNYIFVEETENVCSSLYLWSKTKDASGEIVWSRSKVKTPDVGVVNVWGIDADHSDEYFMQTDSLLSPSTLFYGKVAAGGNCDERLKVKSQPEFFDAKDLQVGQFEVTSKDGTKVPYFMVSKKEIKLDGKNPAILYGYGGFEHSMLPSYRAVSGAAWMERGGVYVLSNIRGGGEFGPDWHKAARKENRQKAYDDFIAIAEDLIKRKVTSPSHLGIHGGSNGGLLMGVMLTQRPDLFGAVVCGSPLLDMRRYNKLLSGASWMDEYGDPDKEAEWRYISKYSPYQNIKRDVTYPEIFIETSTRDDRVHPGHARKMAAKLKEYGHKVLYYENIEGGHSAAANNKQSAYLNALTYSFFWDRLK